MHGEEKVALPIDLVLVRHGQSEGNAAKRLSEQGDHSAYTATFRERHTAHFRLTDLGREQAGRVGRFIKQEFLQHSAFDRYLTSEYVRAMETAAHLELPGAEWLCDFYLTERNWGELDSLPENERYEKFGDALRRRKVEPFFWASPNGETFTDLCLRVDRVLGTLHRECSDKRVIVVCHGEVMWAFRVRLERMSQVRFRQLYLSTRPDDRIHNCQVFHYTRCDPETRRLASHANWMRWARPSEDQGGTEWMRIARPRYSNTDLLGIVAAHEQLLR
jgi:NAD+ kinase